MGQTLSEPLTTKHSASCENARFKVGSSSMQGWRVSMEDAHTHVLELPGDNDAAFFGVFDGHGGSAIAKYAAANLHKFIVQRSEYKNGDIPTAITSAFLEIDQSMQNDIKLKNEVCGTTAITCLIKGNKLYCGNVGDSRAIACINGECHPLSFDHKPNNPSEEARIREAGGWVEFNRVNGNLALSRALGDFSFKRNPNKTPQEQMVCAVPDVEERVITDDWEFVVLACDGIWDVVTNEEACDLVQYHLGSGTEPEKVCEELLQTCLAPDCQMGGLGCDNMTMVLICFLNGKSWDTYCSKIASGLDNKMVENSKRWRNMSTIDSSSDDDDVIPSDKLGYAKSVAASLCYSLSTKGSNHALKADNSLVNDAGDIQNALKTEDYVHKPKTGELVANPEPGTSSEIETVNKSSSTALMAELNAEILPEFESTNATSSSSPMRHRNSNEKGKSSAKKSPAKKNS